MQPSVVRQAVAEWEAAAAEREAEYAKFGGGVAEGDGADAPAFVAYVPLPEQQEIEARARARRPPLARSKRPRD